MLPGCVLNADTCDPSSLRHGENASNECADVPAAAQLSAMCVENADECGRRLCCASPGGMLSELGGFVQSGRPERPAVPDAAGLRGLTFHRSQRPVTRLPGGELFCKQNVGRLALRICRPFVVLSSRKVQVFKLHFAALHGTAEWNLVFAL